MGFFGSGLEAITGESLFGEADEIKSLPQSKEAVAARNRAWEATGGIPEALPTLTCGP